MKFCILTLWYVQNIGHVSNASGEPQTTHTITFTKSHLQTEWNSYNKQIRQKDHWTDRRLHEHWERAVRRRASAGDSYVPHLSLCLPLSPLITHSFSHKSPIPLTFWLNPFFKVRILCVGYIKILEMANMNLNLHLTTALDYVSIIWMFKWSILWENIFKIDFLLFTFLLYNFIHNFN